MKKPTSILIALLSAIAPASGAAPAKSAPAPKARPGYTLVDTGHNGEIVELPTAYVKRTADLHAKLKDKLSPGDYAEIVKGEYYLFQGNPYCFNKGLRTLYGTPGAYEDEIAPSGKYLGDIKKSPEQVINKLEEILQHPEDPHVFARCMFQPDIHIGVFYRDGLEGCGDGVVHADDRYILTQRRGGFYGGCLTTDFWDTRTLDRVAAFASPVIPYGTARCGNTYIYNLVDGGGDAETSSWDGSYWYCTLSHTPENTLVDPANHTFQTFHAGERGKDPWAVNKTLPKGNLYKAAGYKLPDPYSTSPDFSTGELALLRLNRSTMLSSEEDGRLFKGETNVEEGTRTVIQPLGANQLRIQRGKGNVSVLDLGKLTLTRGDAPHPGKDSHGWSFFHEYTEILQKAYRDEITGIVRESGEKLYFPTTGEETLFPIPDQGSLTTEEPDHKKADGNFWHKDTSYMSLIRIHPISDHELELVLGGEVHYNADSVARIRVNTKDKTFRTLKRWDFTHSVLAPAWIPEREWLLLPVSDNQYRILHVPEDGAESKVADFYLYGDNGFAIVLPDGRFAGSPGCEYKLGFADDSGETGMDALAPWRNRPAEVLEALGGDPDAVAALRETTRRWLRKIGYDPDAMPVEPSPADFPEAHVELPHLAQRQTDLSVQVELVAKGAAIKDVVVRADGQPIPQGDGGALQVPAGRTETVTVRVPLIPGHNWIEITPVDADGLAGATQRFRVVCKAEAPSDVFVVSVGVSSYEREGLDLRHAAKDARDIAEAFRKTEGNVRILTMTDGQFKDKTALGKISGFLAAARPCDRVVLYFAGHGVLDDRLDYHFAPAAFNPDDVRGTGVSMDALVECLSSSPARKKLLLLDTCHAGTVGEADEQKLAEAGIPLPQGVRAISKRGMKATQAKRPLTGAQTRRYIEEMFSNDTGLRGLNIMSASDGAGYALESDLWENGVFAMAVLDALANGPGACPFPQFTVEDMEGHILRVVKEKAGDAQRPTISCSENPRYFIIPASKHSPQASTASRSAESLLHEGMDYAWGRNGKSKDCRRAKELYEAAAAQGSAEAMYLLARLHRYRLDDSVSDPAQAPIWYQKAADLGHDQARLELANLMFGQPQQQQDGFGSRSADSLLQEGIDYAYARNGKPKDYRQAKIRYEAAAARGSAEAMYLLARLHRYRLDDSVSDPALAPYWYQKAAGLGHAKARQELQQLK